MSAEREACDLTFARHGDRYETRAGWTAIIEGFEWPTVRGELWTDYGTTPMRWRLDGTTEAAADDLVARLP